MADEPMSDERLAEIRRCMMRLPPGEDAMKALLSQLELYSTIPAMLAESERLRAENAAMREIMQAVATAEAGGGSIIVKDEGDILCGFCGHMGMFVSDAAIASKRHSPECPVTWARSFLYANPAPDK